MEKVIETALLVACVLMTPTSMLLAWLFIKVENFMKKEEEI